MPTFKTPFTPAGVMPATLLAFDEDFNIDAAATRAHIVQVAAVPGVTAIIVNGHASEVHACTFEEQRQLLRIAVEAAGATVPIVAGVYAEGSREAAQLAAMAEAEGASALLVFPPNSLAGGMMRPDMAVAHFQAVAAASSLPIILFQYAVGSALGYPLPLLLKLIDAVPSIVAIKDNSSDPQVHDHQIRALHQRTPRIAVLTSHSPWLLASLSMGCDGIISGAGSIIADLQVALFDAVQKGDLRQAQAVADRLYPANSAFYRAPYMDMHNRMKEGLVMLGRQERAVVRAPLCKLDAGEIAGIRSALQAAELL